MREVKQFRYDSIWDIKRDNGRTEWIFTCAMCSTCPEHFEDCESNHEVESILRKHKVIRKNNTTDTEGCQLWAYFSTEKAGHNFIDRLNKFLREYRPKKARYDNFEKVG